jgi:hypothetical protein
MINNGKKIWNSKPDSTQQQTVISVQGALLISKDLKFFNREFSTKQ